MLRTQTFPADYAERVYAGVLGKIIGVYLGRPFEGWSHDRIMRELGEVNDYVHERFDVPLVVTDDDIAGSFTFPRALEDNGYDPNLTPAQIGDTWLNYLIERQTILWWGGIGNSTEHTAYMRLINGINAPESGSIALNGKTIAEQIGSQIFIDAWAMMFPGDPERAVDFAGRAASVSHDGEAIYGAQVIAALEAQAFVERDLNKLLDGAVSLIPQDSVIARLIRDLREWHATEPDWYKTLARIQEVYGYDTYRGNCHMVPNHALIIFALLYGEDDFQKSLMIANTSGWDTDCNSGNVGAILGIKNGLAGIDSSVVDWRGPVADRLFNSTADGSRAISDAVIETDRIIKAASALADVDYEQPKNGARFHFSYPGSVQGFEADNETTTVSNADGKLHITVGAGGTASASTPTFMPANTSRMRGYVLIASPTLYPGQVVHAHVEAPSTNQGSITAALGLTYFGEEGESVAMAGPSVNLAPGTSNVIEWTIPQTSCFPIARIAVSADGADGDAVLVDRIAWSGAPSTTFDRPAGERNEHGWSQPETLWRRAWVNGVEQWEQWWKEPFRLVQNRGTGLISIGTEDWDDYTIAATMTIPLARSAGLAARVRGLRTFYGLVLGQSGELQIIRRRNEEETVLASAPCDWDPDAEYAFSFTVKGNELTGSVNGGPAITATDTESPLLCGTAGVVVSEGTVACGAITIQPA